ncbi:hypothetical protein B0F90DRAFT_1820022 [Multifurca ochricompacta]|uniref:Uncharacterized protein n=1 Tax=Multifurca ochricompacta TaxID=376703 RepID=A0AAD4LZ72_9AGAM|nr:hypothetical protein B0F90DRAFT_1820022 [Multifurca ochricompacta]
MQFIKTLVALSLAAFALAAPLVAPVENAAAKNPEGITETLPSVGGVNKGLLDDLLGTLL